MIRVGNLSQLLAGPKPEYADQIPAVNGRRRRVAAPVPGNRDSYPQVRHLPVSHLDGESRCAACNPKGYASFHAKHRAGGTR